jgi:hypothetical protein
VGMRKTDNAAESRWFTQSRALACTTDIHDSGMSIGIQVWTQNAWASMENPRIGSGIRRIDGK